MTAPTLTDDQVAEILRWPAFRHGRVEADGCRLRHPLDRGRPGTGPSAGGDPPGGVLRHTRTHPQRGRPRGAGEPIQGGEGDTVVKLRPVVPDQLSKELRRSASFGVEVDAMPGGYVCSGSMKGTSTAADIRQVILGECPVRLLSKEQRTVFKAHAPEGIGLNDLAILGPLNLFKLKFTPEDFGRKVVAEMWLYPDGSRILELSTKCRPREAFQVSAEARGIPDTPRGGSRRRTTDEDEDGDGILRRAAQSRRRGLINRSLIRSGGGTSGPSGDRRRRFSARRVPSHAGRTHPSPPGHLCPVTTTATGRRLWGGS